MDDSLKLGMFFPGELLSITSVDHDDSSFILIKCDLRHILPNVQSVVRKPKLIMEHIYARFRIYRFWEKLHVNIPVLVSVLSGG